MPHRPTILALALILLTAMMILPFGGVWILRAPATGTGSVLTGILLILLLFAVGVALPRIFRRR